MRPGDTSLGGPAKEFAKTARDLISRARDSSPEVRQAGLEDLCRAYWKPIYTHIRLVWNKSNEDAKDLTQAFLLWLVDGEALRRYAPERAAFRTYLKTLLKHFVQHQDTALHRLKRGGGIRILALNDGVSALDEILRDSRGVEPERIFDRVWMTDLVKRAVDRVTDRFLSSGRTLHIQVFEAYDGASGEKATYATLAKRLGIKESEVTNYLFSVREAIRSEVKSELSTLTRSPEELEEEWNDFLKL
jgi:DNA-directed RNA polymerase specialized sigma24 family protein